MSGRLIAGIVGTACALAGCARAPGSGPEVKIGSKKFTESVILGELVAEEARSAGARPLHRRELGGTQVLWHALERGEIDVYPEYTGTIGDEILGRQLDQAGLRQALAAHGVRMSRSLGFNNTYAIGMKEEIAARLGIRVLSDLRHHPELRLGFSDEFMNRKDGWPSLRERYQLPQGDVRGLDHDLAYRGLAGGALDAIDLYSTDAEIRYYRLRVLEDDRHVFPDYHAVLLYRADLGARAPAALAAILSLEGRLSERAMIDLNARAKLDKVPEGRIAAEFLTGHAVASNGRDHGGDRLGRLAHNARDHLLLVAISLGAAIAVSVPLGILAARRPALGQALLAVVGIIQTIPSLALLVFMIPLLGIGAPPAIVALFLYSLLPIVRNTYAGLTGIASGILESADALGLPAGARLWRVELPMASPTILAGIKTSAVINVGTATLGAVIGAGGFGQPILTGIRLDSIPLILEGAVPAALLALSVQGLFELAERWLVPRGLRLKPSQE